MNPTPGRCHSLGGQVWPLRLGVLAPTGQGQCRPSPACRRPCQRREGRCQPPAVPWLRGCVEAEGREKGRVLREARPRWRLASWDPGRLAQRRRPRAHGRWDRRPIPGGLCPRREHWLSGFVTLTHSKKYLFRRDGAARRPQVALNRNRGGTPPARWAPHPDSSCLLPSSLFTLWPGAPGSVLLRTPFGSLAVARASDAAVGTCTCPRRHSVAGKMRGSVGQLPARSRL